MRLVVITAAAVLAGCATPQQQQAKMMADLEAMASICYSVGFQPRTPELQQCAIQLYSQNRASEAQRKANATALGLTLLQMSQPPAMAPPTPVIIQQQPPAYYPPTVIYPKK